jgi:hypothetical protein
LTLRVAVVPVELVSTIGVVPSLAVLGMITYRL